MFNTTSDSQENAKPKDISSAEALGVGGVVLIAVLSTTGAQKKLEAFYFQNYEWIYYAGFGLIAAFAGVLIWFLLRHTKELARRMRLLSEVVKESSGVFAGKTADGLSLHVPDNARTGHVQIIGATGRGKTESVIVPWLARDLAAGHSVIVIDGKGDPELAEKISGIVGCLRKPAHSVVFDLGSPKSSTIINPLSHGTPQQITDRIFTAFSFKEEFYKSVQFDVCQMIVSLIHETSKGKTGAVTFRKLYELLTDDDQLAVLLSDCKSPDLQKQVLLYLSERRDSRDKNCKGLMSQLAPFSVGEVSELVNGVSPADTSRWLSISELVLAEKSDSPTAICILIPTLMYQEIGQQLGRLLLQELSWAVGQRASQLKGELPFLPVFLDEFASFVYPGFTNVLNKARSSGVALHLSHQSLGDLSVVSKDFATVVNTNTNVKCLLGLNDPETADFFARHMGTMKDEKTTERAKKDSVWASKKMTGEMSVREVESYKVHPNDLKNFTSGRGVLHMPSPRRNITEVIQFARISYKEKVFS